MLNEQHLVSDLTVDQLVHSTSRQKKTESAGAHSLFLSLHNMCSGIIGGICNSRVGERFPAEARPGVTHLKHQCSPSANSGDFNHLFGIERRSVLHCIQQYLSQPLHCFLPCFIRQLSAQLFRKRHEAFSSDEAAIYADGNPAGLGR